MKSRDPIERAENSIVETDQRLAGRLDSRLSWIDGDDIAQDVRLRRLETGHPLGRVVQEVGRELNHMTRQLAEPEVLSPDSRLRPTETAVFRRMFWRDIIRALHIRFTRGESYDKLDLPMREARTLARKYVRDDTFVEIASAKGVSDTAIKTFHGKAIRRFHHPRRASLIRDYTEEDFSG